MVLHAGVSIGLDGPSQMALEDLAAFRAIHGSTVLYPCDANQTAWLTAILADREGVSYLRLTRGPTPVIYEPGEEFPVGGSRVLRSSADDQVTIAAAGITVPGRCPPPASRRARVSARVIDVLGQAIDAVTPPGRRRPGASSRSRTTGPRVAWARRYWSLRRRPDEAPPVVRILAVRGCPARPPRWRPARRRGHRLRAITSAALTWPAPDPDLSPARLRHRNQLSSGPCRTAPRLR